MLSSREEHVLWSIPSLFGPTQILQTLPSIAVACNLRKGRGQVGRSTASPTSLFLPATHLSKIEFASAKYRCRHLTFALPPQMRGQGE